MLLVIELAYHVTDVSFAARLTSPFAAVGFTGSAFVLHPPLPYVLGHMPYVEIYRALIGLLSICAWFLKRMACFYAAQCPSVPPFKRC